MLKFLANYPPSTRGTIYPAATQPLTPSPVPGPKSGDIWDFLSKRSPETRALISASAPVPASVVDKGVATNQAQPPSPADDATPASTAPSDVAIYNKVVTRFDFDVLVTKLSRVSHVAVDTETRPRRQDLPADGTTRKYHALTAPLNEIIGISFSFSLSDNIADTENYYIPLRHQDGSEQLVIEEIRDGLDGFFRNRAITKIFANAKFDLKVLSTDGFVVEPLPDDVLLMASLVDLHDLPRVDSPNPSSIRKERYSGQRSSLKLKDLARRHIHTDAGEWEDDLDQWRVAYAKNQTKKGSVKR